MTSRSKSYQLTAQAHSTSSETTPIYIERPHSERGRPPYHHACSRASTRSSRRSLLKGLTCASACLVSAPLSAQAFGRREQVGVTFLDHGEGARLRPRAAEQLMWEVSKRTSIGVREAPRWVTAESPDLLEDPLLVWLGRGEAPPFSELARERLNLYLRAGGSLYIDDISPPGDDRFDRSVRKRIQEIWPESQLREVDAEHTIYRSFFLLDQPYGRLLRSPTLHHISFDDLSPILYGRNDTFGAFGRSPTGEWLLPVTPGGRVQRERAFRFGLNLVMYSACLNYKRDQVHTLTILRRRQFQAR